MAHMEIVYKEMTAEELAEAYNVFLTISDPEGWRNENRAKALILEAQCKPIKDLPYGELPIQKLDLYIPEDAKNTPVLIDIHGGGWISGSKNPRAIPAQTVRTEEIIYVAIDYGLAPEYSMDEMVEHVRQAIYWTYSNIAQYGGDPNNLFIFGNSAGAQLAATALMPGWPQQYNLPPNIIKGAVLTSGIYDLEGHVHAQTGPQEFLKMTFADAKRASPLYHLPTCFMPIVIAYGADELEEFIFESKNYASVLTKAGFDVTLIEVPSAHHFDMINELSNQEGKLFQVVKKMIKQK